MPRLHFISGLPRSGSTLLAALLRQNPSFHASISSPMGMIFSAMQAAISGKNEAAGFISDFYRERLLRGAFDAFYDDGEVIFDTNRAWCGKLPVLLTLYPDAKVICCVRSVAWIMDSIERLIRKNPLQLSGLFGFEPGGTVYSRCDAMAARGGLIGGPLDALREAWYGEYAKRMLVIDYEALAKQPGAVLDTLYDFLGEPGFGHSYEVVEQIPGAAAFDERLGTPGLHHVGERVMWRERAPCLPPGLFAQYSEGQYARWWLDPALSANGPLVLA